MKIVYCALIFGVFLSKLSIVTKAATHEISKLLEDEAKEMALDDWSDTSSTGHDEALNSEESLQGDVLDLPEMMQYENESLNDKNILGNEYASILTENTSGLGKGDMPDNSKNTYNNTFPKSLSFSPERENYNVLKHQYEEDPSQYIYEKMVKNPSFSSLNSDQSFLLFPQDRSTLSVEYRLVYDILSHYNKHIRPVAEPGDVTHVFLELSLFDILSLDTKHQTLKTNTEVVMKWIDVHLIWDPSQYENISVIRIPYYDIWYPDIILYNTAEADYESGILYTNAIIRYTGEVELVSHSIFSSICNVDIQWYPFDQQHCPMVFGSWTYDHDKIQLILGPADISDFSENPEYLLENFHGEQVETFNPCCTYPMSTIIFHLQLQRRTKFALFFYLMPGILINLCAVMVFSLPAESGEKIGLGINSMLAMIVFLMAMTEKLPPTEKIPLAGLYYGVCLSVITINIAFSVFILNINVAGDRRRRIPEWLKYFTIWLTKYLGNRIPEVVQEEWGIDEERNFIKTTMVKSFKEPKDFDIVSALRKRKHSIQSTKNEDVKNYDDLKELKDAFQRRVIFALETIATFSKHQDERIDAEQDKERLSVQWKFISRVLDRLLFILFFLVAFLFNVTILTSSPFGERFHYCPLGENQCDEMTREEILKLAKKMALEVTRSHTLGH